MVVPAALRPFLAVTAALALSTGCGLTSSSKEGFQHSPHVVTVVMSEYRFDAPASVDAGRVVVEARNDGRLDHELVLARLPEDFPPIDEQLRGSVRRSVPMVAAVPPRGPGERGTFAVDLAPGRYAFICYLPDEDGVQHSTKGMSAEIQVV